MAESGHLYTKGQTLNYPGRIDVLLQKYEQELLKSVFLKGKFIVRLKFTSANVEKSSESPAMDGSDELKVFEKSNPELNDNNELVTVGQLKELFVE